MNHIAPMRWVRPQKPHSVSARVVLAVSTDLGSPAEDIDLVLSRKTTVFFSALILRKEVIQPHLPIRLPCYDFVPLAPHTFGDSPLAVGPSTSGADNSGDVTGGVYKARERIHRSLADLRLLAIPTSCSRVADCNPN